MVHARISQFPTVAPRPEARHRLALGVVAGITATVAADLAAPDSDEGTGGAIRAAPSQNIAICSLDDGEDMAGALVCHCYSSFFLLLRIN